MKSQKGFTVVELLMVIVGVFIASGWLMNISKLVELGIVEFDNVVTLLRLVGIIVVPLGAIMGWFF